jgi:pyruvate dehydrogenase E1 component beta subunit
VHEAPRSFGPGAEIVSRLVEKSFWYLEAPIRRVTGFDTIMPLLAYEQAYLPSKARILRAARETLSV